MGWPRRRRGDPVDPGRDRLAGTDRGGQGGQFGAADLAFGVDAFQHDDAFALGAVLRVGLVDVAAPQRPRFGVVDGDGDHHGAPGAYRQQHFVGDGWGIVGPTCRVVERDRGGADLPVVGGAFPAGHREHVDHVTGDIDEMGVTARPRRPRCIPQRCIPDTAAATGIPGLPDADRDDRAGPWDTEDRRDAHRDTSRRPFNRV